MIETPEALASEILAQAVDRQRFIIGLAGPPGVGKSTLTATLQDLLNNAGQGHAVTLPMDGYHLDNQVLDDLGLRAKKGAPETFDALGFAADLKRVRTQLPDGKLGTSGIVYVPFFDRDADLARACAIAIKPEDRFVLVEGNYLLLDEEPWSSVEPLFDLTVGLLAPPKVLEQRLIERWIQQGFDNAMAVSKAGENDLVNARKVIDGSREPTLRYHSA